MVRGAKNILKHVKLMVEAGVMQPPKWLDVIAKVPPIALPRIRRPQVLRYAEDPLIQSFYAAFPEGRLEPIDLAKSEPPLARRFAAQQLELMKKGMSRAAAFKATVDRMGLEDADQHDTDILLRVQHQEEAQLRLGLDEHFARHPELESQDTLLDTEEHLPQSGFQKRAPAKHNKPQEQAA